MKGNQFGLNAQIIEIVISDWRLAGRPGRNTDRTGESDTDRGIGRQRVRNIIIRSKKPVIKKTVAGFSLKILNSTFPPRKKPVISGNLRKRHFLVRSMVPRHPAATGQGSEWSGSPVDCCQRQSDMSESIETSNATAPREQCED